MSKVKVDEWLTDEQLLIIEGWARDGLTDEQIALNIGVSVRTLYRWKNNFWQICQALKKGKEVSDRQVDNALFKRAIGYDYEEIREKIKDGIVIEKTVTKKHEPGDTTAQIFWLKNRKATFWNNNDNSDFNSTDNTNVVIYLPHNERREEKINGKL